MKTHLDNLCSIIKEHGLLGKKLDFICQELNREVNTIASKASDSQISADCIRFKGETEKAREQVQNLE